MIIRPATERPVKLAILFANREIIYARDAAAHQGALAGAGGTIAVWGTGIDRIYPPANKNLAYQIAERGLIVSEFPLDTRPLAGNFPRRNRIIAALAQAVLVVEAAPDSGSP